MCTSTDAPAKFQETDIKDVNEFLQWIKNIQEISVQGDNGVEFSLSPGQWYYRGQSCSEWDLKPSVFRTTNGSNINENKLLIRANLEAWSSVSGMSYLEKIIFFQHHGLSTRLLDVTFNPLVALYMACSDKNRRASDGAVYCGYKRDTESKKLANATAKYVFEHELQPTIENISTFASNEGLLAKEFQRPVFILPPIINPRIESQNGAFIMAPLLGKEIENDSYYMNRNGLEHPEYFHDKKAIIRKDAKEDILHELSILGINEGTIFKGVDAKMASIMAEESYNIHVADKINILSNTF